MVSSIGMAIGGGLLQGLGAGLTARHEERRQNALLAIKRAYQIEDRAYEREVKQEDRAADLEAKKELLGYGTQMDIAKAEVGSNLKRAERAVDYDYDVKLETLRSSLTEGRTRRLTEAEVRLRNSLDAGDVQSVQKGADGTAIVFYKDGRQEATGVKLHLGGGDGEEGGGTIADARTRRGGEKPASQPAAAKPALSDEDKARVATLYASATPETRPYMFDQAGNKYPLEMVLKMVEGRLKK